MLRGVAVGGLALPLLAACGGEDGTAGSDSSAEPTAAESSSGDSSGAEPSESAAGAGVTVAAADVPVGGGTILKADKVVVTQPTEGDFKAFSAVCTHQGCTVGSVTDGQIVCPCHQSHFSIEDGSPVSGPASAPLAAKKATAAGGEVSVT
jgi:Rieske Fe-S protein